MPSSPKRPCSYPGCSELVASGYCEKHKVYSYYPNLKRSLRCRVNMVIGAPGSGKNFFVDRNKKPGDIVIDLDGIKSEISGKSPYALHDHAVIEQAIQERNRRIEDLQDAALPGKSLWFIAGAGHTTDRFLWKRMLTPYRTFVMYCSLETCIQRIKERNCETESELIQAAERWFKAFEPMSNETFVNSESREMEHKDVAQDAI